MSRLGCPFVQVERARLHFDYKAVMGRVRAFNDSAGVLGRLLSECGLDVLAGALQIATCQEGLDKRIVFLQLTLLLRMMTEEGGEVLELHMTAPPYARRLLDLKVTVDMLEPLAPTPTAALLLAASMGPCDLLLRLLRGRASPSSCAVDGSTALHFAAACRQLPACRALLDAHADPNALRGEHGILPPGGRAGLDANRAPVQIAACGGFVSGLRLLSERGADFEHEDWARWMHAAPVCVHDVPGYPVGRPRQFTERPWRFTQPFFFWDRQLRGRLLPPQTKHLML